MVRWTNAEIRELLTAEEEGYRAAEGPKEKEAHIRKYVDDVSNLLNEGDSYTNDALVKVSPHWPP